MDQAYSMDRETFRALSEQHEAQSKAGSTPYTLVSRQIPADLETPVSALLKIRQGPHAFLLESVERGTQVGRYSFLGADPQKVLTIPRVTPRGEVPPEGGAPERAAARDPFGELERALAARRLVVPEGEYRPRFTGGAVGYLGYEAITTLEPVPSAGRDALDFPDVAFAFYDAFVVFDHVERTARVVALAKLCVDSDIEYDLATRRIDRLVRRLSEPMPRPGNRAGERPPTSSRAESNLSPAEFEALVERAKEHILAGDAIQIVLSQRLDRHTTADPATIYRALRMVNPSPYMFYLQFGDYCLVGASPEMLVQVQMGRVVTHPIAGTRPRGRDKRDDVLMEKELLADEKERAEHLMLVDLGRNDLGRISELGSVAVPRFMEVERYSHVMHLVSEVEGRLRPGLGPVDVLRAAFPAGTVSGAPKVRAMQIIAEQERERRGPYAGAAGYIGYDGNMDTAIAIRTIAIKDGLAHVQVGAGIVADSVPANEYRETLSKAQALLSAIDLAEDLERDEPSGETPRTADEEHSHDRAG